MNNKTQKSITAGKLAKKTIATQNVLFDDPEPEKEQEPKIKALNTVTKMTSIFVNVI